MKTDGHFELLTFAEVGRKLNVSAHTVAKWIESGSLRAVRPSVKSRRYVMRRDLESFIERMRFGENPEVTDVRKTNH